MGAHVGTRGPATLTDRSANGLLAELMVHNEGSSVPIWVPRWTRWHSGVRKRIGLRSSQPNRPHSLAVRWLAQRLAA